MTHMTFADAPKRPGNFDRSSATLVALNLVATIAFVTYLFLI